MPRARLTAVPDSVATPELDHAVDTELIEVDQIKTVLVEHPTDEQNGEVKLEIAELRAKLLEREAEIDTLRARGKMIARELDLFRQRRIVSWFDRFRNDFNAWNLMSPSFQQLKDDTLIFNGDMSGYRLQPSVNLQRVSWLDFRIRLDRSHLSGILIAPILDVPLDRGIIRLHVTDAGGRVLAESNVPVSDFMEDSPALFSFAPIADSHKQELNVRIFAFDGDSPVRIFEMRKFSFWGFGKIIRKAFCAFVFD